MSRLTRAFIYASFLMLAAVCAGCEQGADLAFDAQEEKCLFVTVAGVADENRASRSLMPTVRHDLTDSELSFTLSGVSDTGKRIDEMSVDFADGTAAIPLDPMFWSLTLTARKETGGEPVPVLRGFSVADMRAGSASVRFVLSSDGLYGDGTVAITGKIPHNGVATKITVGVYKKSAPEQPIPGTVQDFAAADGDEIAFAYETTMPAGNYLFCISCQNADGTPCGSYCDTLIVEPGLETKRDFGTLDIAANLPTDPGAISASLGDETPDGSTRRVTLSWTGGQYAERYELRLETTTGNTVYTADGADGSQLFAESNIYGGGNVLYGSQGCELLLAPGTYAVRLRARNRYGVSSEWDDAPKTAEVTVP